MAVVFQINSTAGGTTRSVAIPIDRMREGSRSPECVRSSPRGTDRSRNAISTTKNKILNIGKQNSKAHQGERTIARKRRIESRPPRPRNMTALTSRQNSPNGGAHVAGVDK